MNVTDGEREWMDHNAKVIEALWAAEDRGDMDEHRRLMRKLVPPAEALLATKEGFGADMVRRLGVDTRLADEEYGPGWLDEE